MIPEIALGRPMGAEQRLTFFAELGMSEAAARELSRTIEAGATALARHGLCDGWRSALADWLRGIWFTVRGSNRCTMPRVVVRPGDPPADIVFASAFCAFQKLLNAELQARELFPTVEVAGPGIFRTEGAPTESHIFQEIVYMDDLAIIFEAQQHWAPRRPPVTLRARQRLSSPLCAWSPSGGVRSGAVWQSFLGDLCLTRLLRLRRRMMPTAS